VTRHSGAHATPPEILGYELHTTAATRREQVAPMSTVHAESSPGRSDTVPASGVRTFIRLWCSQWLVVFAAAQTVLVFNLNIFAEFASSQAALVFAFLVLFAPFGFLSPLAGALVDRWGTGGCCWPAMSVTS
jgi:hypothetical protein